MTTVDLISALLLAIGCFFAITGGVGILRMPDFYTRLHAAGKVDSLAQALILSGLMVQAGLSLVSVKLLLIIVFLLATTPTATHAVAKAAHLSRLKPWRAGKSK
ncbi:MAG: monovalent cation/H(+) antiporter subunit G [Pseudomonadota bacterium]|nr:MAG: monovalent cation/H(+) antiporter subunit G [Pseudomonadota bacterium]